MKSLKFPALRGKDIVILYDYLEKFEPNDVIEILEMLFDIKKQIEFFGYKVHLENVTTDVAESLAKYDPSKVVIFNWCEQYGDIKDSFHLIPLELEKLGFAYTGCDAKAIELTADKIATKDVLLREKVTTPLSKVYRRMGKHLNGWHNFPAIVKPQLGHSSIGITSESIINTTEELIDRVNTVINKYKCSALVEEFIDGREFLVGVWGYDQPEVLPPVELLFDNIENPKERIYSFKTKWEETSPECIALQVVVPEIASDILATLKEEAVKSYRSTGCNGYARIDIRYKDGKAYVLDVNANPDMTTYSEFLKSAKHVGYNYGAAILKLCEIALQREVNVDAYSADMAEETSKEYLPAVSMSFAS